MTYGDRMPHEQPPAAGPVVTSAGVGFRLPDSAGVDGVRLVVDWPLGATDPDLRRHGDVWSVQLPRPPVDRMEYQFAVRARGTTSWITDPGNPLRVPNPYGDKSEIRFAEYVPPLWLATRDRGSSQDVPTARGELEVPVPTTLWSPDGLYDGTPAPLLVAHDGSDMAERGSLLRWATHAAQERPFRVALLDPAPGRRHEWYAAAPLYSDHLHHTVLPAIGTRVSVSTTVGLGASLGALAMLALQRRHPGSLDAMALQSGSFFTGRLDPQESGYEFFDQVCAAVVDLAAGPAAHQGRVLITCGAVEENRANNEQMARALVAQGYRVEMHLLPDAHTMIGWRDGWSPGLEILLDATP